MIKDIECIAFQDSVTCESSLYQSKESFLQVNYHFKSGNIYGLVSDYGCGSWGLTTCLGGRCSEYYTGEILINGSKTSAKYLECYSGFVGENIFNGINIPLDHLTPNECIKKALEISGQPYTVEQIKNIFALSHERFERNLTNVSGEIQNISIAINFALGKNIFCFPWLNEHDIFNISKPILNFLKDQNKIVLIPTSQYREIKKIANHTITFKCGKIIYR